MNFIIGLIISILVIVLFYGYIAVCFKCVKVEDFFKNISKKEWIGIFCFFILTTMFVNYMVQKNRFIYFWDYSMHWVPTFSMEKMLFQDPIATMKTVWNTIGTTDYNWLMPLLYVLPAKIFGSSYETMIVLIHIFYMCPSFLVISVCINKFLELAGYKKRRILLYALLVFAMPLVEYVFLKGFWDPPVLMLSAILLLLASDFQYDHFEFKRATLMVIGILTIVIFRRHWAYWIIGYILFLVIEMCFQLHKNTFRITIKYFLENMAYIGICCSILLVLPLRPFLQHSLRNYSELYVAWGSDIIQKIGYINDAFGNFLFLIILGFILCIWKSRKSIKNYVGMLVLIAVPIFLMMNTSTMQNSHFYFAVVPIMICLALSVECCLECLKVKTKKYIMYLVLTLLLIYNFLACFWSNIFLSDGSRIKKAIFCDLGYEVLYRDDIENIQELVDYLNEKTEEYHSNVYICASSLNINSQILSLAYAPEETNCMKNLLPEANVDLRDGFSTDFFDAGIVVTEDFVDDTGYYMGDGNVGVVHFLADSIEDASTPVSKHYELLKEFTVHWKYGSTVKVWRKVSDYEESDYNYLIDYYDKTFPEHPELFSDRIKAYAQQNQ